MEQLLAVFRSQKQKRGSVMKQLLMVLLIAAVAVVSFLPVSGDAAQTGVQLVVGNVPEVDSGNYVSGRINLSSGKYGDYAVTMYLEVSEGGRIWGPKPTHANPSVPINDSGEFRCLFNTGGHDYSARVLYVFVVPANFTPTDNFDRTKNVAVAMATINRSGGIRITYNFGG